MIVRVKIGKFITSEPHIGLLQSIRRLNGIDKLTFDKLNTRFKNCDPFDLNFRFKPEVEI